MPTRKDILWLSLISLLAIILYIPTLRFELTYLDDNVWILDYHWYLKNIANWSNFFTQQDLITGFFYRPILNLTFMFNAVISGQNLAGYRIFNLALHVVNIVLVYFLLNRFSFDKAKTYFLTLAFAVHPALVSSVVWIPGRTDSLLGTFIFLSFINFLSYLEKRSWVNLLGHLIFLFLALLTKETAAALFLLAAIYIRLEKGWKGFDRHLLTGWVVVGLFWLALRLHALEHAIAMNKKFVLTSLFQNMPGFISYFGKVFFPVNLSVVPNLRDLSLWPGFIILLAISDWVFLSKNRKNSFVIFGCLWFVLFIFPSLIYSFILHEYRLYVPMVGLLILLTQLKWPKDKYISWTAGCAVTMLFLMFSYFHTQHFKDRMTYWKNAVKTSPHLPLAHRNLGAMYHLENKLDLAKPCYEEALRLNPVEYMAHNNLGLIALSQGDLKKAEEEFLSEVRVNPVYDNVYYNLGVLYARQGRHREAERAWQKTIELNPKYIGAYDPLIDLYIKEGDIFSAQKYDKKRRALGF